MLTLAIIYILNAYPGTPRDVSVYELCEIHAEHPPYPQGYPLVGEACDYVRYPYLEERL